MAQSAFLYVLLPDGRIWRTRGTATLRRHLKSGRIPRGVRVRRSANEPWRTLDQVKQLADLATHAMEPGQPPQTKTRAARKSPKVGVRACVNELFHALDCSLQRAKLAASACTGLGIGLTLVISDITMSLMPTEWAWVGYLATGMVLLALFSVCTSIITQMTALELSRYRPAQFREIRADVWGYSLRIALAVGVVGGSLLGLICLLRWLPGWITPAEPGAIVETFIAVIHGVRMLLEVACVPIAAFMLLLLGPILVVEECSIWRGWREWLGILRQHLGRVYIYQAIAFSFAIVLTLPLMIPAGLALNVGTAPFLLLFGVALTPMLNYLLVAHVFVYLNLRYDYYSARKDFA